jgi:hypothetical protein
MSPGIPCLPTFLGDARNVDFYGNFKIVARFFKKPVMTKQKELVATLQELILCFLS